jgi:D-cysteine desulfhydrase
MYGQRRCDVLLESLQWDDVNLCVVRDDVFPFIGGGSKARKAIYYEAFLKEHGYNAVVTCGGIQSNHNRAIALMAAKNGWKCHLCIQGESERFLNEKGNALLDRLSGAECELIKPEDTAAAMDRAMSKLETEGYKPFYVHGGGHDLPGGIAFVDAIKSLKDACSRMGYKPDYIFHASGTGSTQAGILVGLDRVGWKDVKVIGISVARQYERGRQVIVDFANMLAEHYGMEERYDSRVHFCTDYLYGGYEKYTPEMDTYLHQVMKSTGLIFDTTYSGKAFFGMMDIIRKKGLQEKNVVFWHTGGIMNVLR